MDKYLESLKVGKSALVDSWFMMSSPIPITLVVVGYLLYITIGPKLMKNREPFKMEKLLMYYNVFQVLLALLICFKVSKLTLFSEGILYAGCRYTMFTQNPTLLDLGWWYFFAKLTELLDTVFFVLRKKNKQISFLHVYHHAIMALYSWSYLKFAAGGDGAILALLNSAVHVVMYTYYLLAGMGPQFQKYLWWKKYVTKMQLIFGIVNPVLLIASAMTTTQFGLMLAYCGWTHFSPRCQYATGFTYFISGNVIIFLFLFLNFYTKSYKGKGKKSAEDEIKAEYEKMRNGFCKNGINKNGIKKCDKKQNGVCTNDCKDVPNLEEIPYEVRNACGDYAKGTKVFLTRRTATATYGPDYDFDSVIKK